MSKKIENVSDSAESLEIEKEEVAKSAESNKKDSALFDLNQKVDTIGADLKSVIDKIDSFEVDTDQILENVSYETKESKSDKKGAVALIVAVLVLIAFVFKDKIANAIEQKRQNP